MAFLNDHASRFRKGLSNPFTATGLQYCIRCKTDVDTRIESHHQGTTYAFKQWCRRCGHVIARGVSDNVLMLSGRPLPPAALEWSIAPEKITK